VVVDLFAGTGALGLEALSRGAAKVVFLERDRNHIKFIESNLAAVRKAMGTANAECSIVCADARNTPSALADCA
jgi:16S rRNA (guanine966-N2)-methyltransferase